jgi:hypothetical protein
MNNETQILNHFAGLPQSKTDELIILHRLITQILPNAKLWFIDGKDENGKIVANLQIGYGNMTIKYANGKTKDFFQIGISPNTKGISVYIMGIDDKMYLPKTYGKSIGKANVTGYCIKFGSLNEINIDVLETAIRDGLEFKP